MVTPEKLREWASLMSHLGAVMHQVGDSEICVEVAVAAQEMFDAANEMDGIEWIDEDIEFTPELQRAIRESWSVVWKHVDSAMAVYERFGLTERLKAAPDDFGAGVFN